MEGTKEARILRPHKISESSKVYRCGDHSGLVLQCLNEQRHAGLFCDVVLLVGGQRLPAHRNILSACSDYFRSMFTIGMKEAFQKEVELLGSSYGGLKPVVDFLYGCDLSLDGGNIGRVLETANLLQVWKVVDLCCDYLESELSAENYLYLQELASTYSLKRLDADVDAFVLRNFNTLCFTPAFLQNVSKQKLRSYLKSNEVQHECEDDLLRAALQWLAHCPGRERDAYSLLEDVRFPLIPKDDLLHRVKPALSALSGCGGLVEEALHYLDNVAAQPVLQNKRTLLRTREERLLFIGGEVSGHCLELSDETCSLDSEAGQWLREAPLPARRSHHCVAVLGGFVFMAGGSFSRDNGGDAASDLLYRYDPRCDQWIQLASMRQRRVDFYLAAVESTLVAVGGRNENGALSSVEVYSPEKDDWSYVASLPRFTYGHAGAVHNGSVYVSGGHDYQIGPYRRHLLCYDSQAEAWVERQPMLTARGWHTMCTLGERLYAAGGSDDSPETATRCDVLAVEAYSPRCDQWTAVAPLPRASSEAGAAVLGGRLYVLGGYSWEGGAFSRAAQVYDPQGDAWQEGAALPKAVAGGAACACALRTRLGRGEGQPEAQCGQYPGR